MNADKFHSDARSGNLPAFSWFIPPGNQSDHPCNDVRNGEGILKEVYETLRAAPTWDETMLVVTYDDAGGFFDHVIPPSLGVPSDDAPCHKLRQHPNCTKPAFDFRRLGRRMTAFLVSPFVPKNAVFQGPEHGTLQVLVFVYMTHTCCQDELK